MSTAENKWYKRAFDEYVGPDASYHDGTHIQEHAIDAIEGKDGGGLLPGFQAPFGDGSPFTKANQKGMKDVPDVCPVCKQKIVPEEVKSGYHNENGETVYKCTNCGHTNDRWQIKVKRDRGRKPSRLKKRRSSTRGNYTEAQSFPPVNTGPYNNPANTPYGRFDFSEDVRVVPWDNRLEGDYDETWNRNKQKNKVQYKFKKVKDKKGRIHFIPVKDPSKSTGIQPSNTYTQKGDIKKQPRYNPEDGPSKGNSSGTWPHNRAPDPSSGWYQSDEVVDKNKFNAEGRERVRTWEDHVLDRNNQTFTLTKPF